MEILFPFVFIPLCIQFFVLGTVKNRFLRWLPLGVVELFLIVGMVRHIIDPPSFDLLGWKIYLWLIGSVFLGGALAWVAYALYDKRNR